MDKLIIAIWIVGIPAGFLLVYPILMMVWQYWAQFNIFGIRAKTRTPQERKSPFLKITPETRQELTEKLEKALNEGSYHWEFETRPEVLNQNRINNLNAFAKRIGWSQDTLAESYLEMRFTSLTDERDAYAAAGLAAAAGLLPTPEQGYVKDGGPSLMERDLRWLREGFIKYRDEYDALKALHEPTVEQLRMQLAACSTIAIANTRETAAEARKMDSAYWTTASGDVANTVDREMNLREAYEKLEKEYLSLKGQFHEQVMHATAVESRWRNLHALIGSPPEGSHPDEDKPRAATWHQERLNWIAEVGELREVVRGLEKRIEGYAAAPDLLKDLQEEYSKLESERNELANRLNTFSIAGQKQNAYVQELLTDQRLLTQRQEGIDKHQEGVRRCRDALYSFVFSDGKLTDIPRDSHERCIAEEFLKLRDRAKSIEQQSLESTIVSVKAGTTAEQQARDMLDRMGVHPDAGDCQNMTAGDVVELANLIAERDRLKRKVEVLQGRFNPPETEE